MTSPAPDLTIILEWENVLLAEDDRCFEMLRQLRKQLGEIGRSAEIIVLHNPEQVERSVIEMPLREHLGLDEPGSKVELTLEEAVGKHYYELKNEGAARARGRVIVYIDSDVIPEDGWLRAMTDPFFERDDVQVVAGHTYLDYESLMEKAFALGWFFPLRNPKDKFNTKKPQFYANNVAFRREVIQSHPFPPLEHGVTRGSCAKLARQLNSEGIQIWTNTGARVHHPPPSDLGHYFIRGLAHGRDNVLKWSAAGYGFGARFVKSFTWSAGRIARMTKRLRRNWRKVDLPLWQVPLAFVIMFVFYTLSVFSSYATLLFPNYAEKHWRI